MKNGAYVCADAALAGQCTIKRRTYLFDVCDYGAINEDDSGNGNDRNDHVIGVTLQAGKKDTRSQHFVASHSNGVITAVPTGIILDTQRAFPFALQNVAGHTPTVDGIPLSDSTTVNSFVTLEPGTYVPVRTMAQYPQTTIPTTLLHLMATQHAIPGPHQSEATATLRNDVIDSANEHIRSTLMRCHPVNSGHLLLDTLRRLRLPLNLLPITPFAVGQGTLLWASLSRPAMHAIQEVTRPTATSICQWNARSSCLVHRAAHSPEVSTS